MIAGISVIKLGGSTFGDHLPVLEECADRWRGGEPIVLVHGGGKTVTAWSTALGIEARFVDGLRATDEATLEVVLAVIAGLLNSQLVAALQRLGVSAAGLSGVDGGLMRAHVEQPALGLVGEVDSVDSSIIETLLTAGYLPVIATAALGPLDGPPLLNINGDPAAARLAHALHATRLVFLSDVPAVMRADGSRLERLDPYSIEAAIAAGEVTGGMIPKVRSAAGCLDRVGTVHIVDGRQRDALAAVFAGASPGTVIMGALT